MSSDATGRVGSAVKGTSSCPDDQCGAGRPSPNEFDRDLRCVAIPLDPVDEIHGKIQDIRHRHAIEVDHGPTRTALCRDPYAAETLRDAQEGQAAKEIGEIHGPHSVDFVARQEIAQAGASARIEAIAPQVLARGARFRYHRVERHRKYGQAHRDVARLAARKRQRDRRAMVA